MIEIDQKRNTVLSAFRHMGADNQQMENEYINCQNLAYVLDWYEAIDMDYQKRDPDKLPTETFVTNDC